MREGSPKTELLNELIEHGRRVLFNRNEQRMPCLNRRLQLYIKTRLKNLIGRHVFTNLSGREVRRENIGYSDIKWVLCKPRNHVGIFL